jgi:hypothetical protein
MALNLILLKISVHNENGSVLWCLQKLKTFSLIFQNWNFVSSRCTKKDDAIVFLLNDKNSKSAIVIKLANDSLI